MVDSIPDTEPREYNEMKFLKIIQEEAIAYNI